MRCQLHRSLRKTEEITRYPIKYFTSIRQGNNTVFTENYGMKIIMHIISYFICTNVKKIVCILWFQYCSILGNNDND